MDAMIVYGSPNGRNSASYRLGSSFSKGLATSGWNVTEFILSDIDVKHCLGCKNCWTATPGKCVQKDGMSEMLDSQAKANLLILSAPLYFYTLPGKTKDYLDRLMPMFYETVLKTYGKVEQDWLDRIKFILISPCGFPQKDNFDALVATARKIFDRAYAEDFLVPNATGMSFDRNSSEFTDYYQLMERMGTEFGKNMSISKESRDEFEFFTTMNPERMASMRARIASLQKA